MIQREQALYETARRILDQMIVDAHARHAESQADLARMFEWREWFGFRPGWPARRAERLTRAREQTP